MDTQSKQSDTPFASLLAWGANQRGEYHGLKGEFARAETYFRKAVALDPENSEIALNFICNLCDQNRVDEAVAFVRKNLANQLKNYRFWNSYKTLLMEYQKFDEALEIFEKLEKDREFTKDGDFYFEYGHCLLAAEKGDKAIEIFKKSNSLQETPQTYDFLIGSFYQAQSFDAHQNYMHRRLSVNRKDCPMSLDGRWCLLAQFYTAWGASISQSAPQHGLDKLRIAQRYAEKAINWAHIENESNNQPNESNGADLQELMENILEQIQWLEWGGSPCGPSVTEP